MPTLPKDFLKKMSALLGDEYPLFLSSYDAPRQYGLRVNTLKISPEEFLEISPFPVTPIPWTPNGFFYPADARPARHPYYQAGLYYLQEPSAMAPAACLPVTPGESILDLCAAPGGKATELGAKLKGQGFLMANDISASRARALLRNLELFGITNAFVTSEVPAKLAKYYGEFFHKILLDAPCSGEGMFRKEPEVASAWSPEKSRELSKIQKSLLETAYAMLRPGGLLLYSTCTFAPEENEEVIAHGLERFPDMEIRALPEYEGFSPGRPHWGNGDERLAKCRRLWPHKMAGEGHFLALLQKPGTLAKESPGEKTAGPDRNAQLLLKEFFGEISRDFPLSSMEVRGEKAYLLPKTAHPVKGLPFLRNGIYLGDVKKNRFEPSQQLAMALSASDCPRTLRLSPEDERIGRYLRGETLPLSFEEAAKSGWTLVCVKDYPLGWGKIVSQTLKNKYAAGWRLP